MNLATFTIGVSEALDRQAQLALKDAGCYRGAIDGQFGPLSRRALAGWTAAHTPAVHEVFASTFADRDDVAAYRRAKARGLSDVQAFKLGDNGVGLWDNDTTEGSGPQCALPPEDWQHLEYPHGALVEVTIDGRTSTGKLGDTMPHRAAIKNGAGIDLNPDFIVALGKHPGGMWRATWRWA